MAHIHLVFNRVDNNGKTISDSNDRYRSEKICKELTHKYGLYYSTGEENVKQHRLKEPDKSRYEIYEALKTAVPKCQDWKQLIRELERSGIPVPATEEKEETQVRPADVIYSMQYVNTSISHDPMTL